MLSDVLGRIRVFRGGGDRNVSNPISADGVTNLELFGLAMLLENATKGRFRLNVFGWRVSELKPP